MLEAKNLSAWSFNWAFGAAVLRACGCNFARLGLSRIVVLFRTPSPGEIKRREVSRTLTNKLAQKRSRAGRWCWAVERERVGLILLQLFPNGGATELVFVTVHSSWDSNCVVRWSQRNAGRTLPQHFVVLAAVYGSLGLPGWRLFRGFTLLSPFYHTSRSLIGLHASVDVKQKNK